MGGKKISNGRIRNETLRTGNHQDKSTESVEKKREELCCCVKILWGESKRTWDQKGGESEGRIRKSTGWSKPKP